jgi:hypothetical protein
MGSTLIGTENLPARTRDKSSQPDEFPQMVRAMPKLDHTVGHAHAFLGRTGQPQARQWRVLGLTPHGIDRPAARIPGRRHHEHPERAIRVQPE